MSEQLHITHRNAYLKGRNAGAADVLAGLSYRPGPLSTDEGRAFSLGYGDGWAKANPCENGTCGHLAH